MSSVLYYSKYCENCKKLLYELGKTDVQKNVHFLSIDRRINRGDKIYIQLDNGHVNIYASKYNQSSIFIIIK